MTAYTCATAPTPIKKQPPAGVATFDFDRSSEGTSNAAFQRRSRSNTQKNDDGGVWRRVKAKRRRGGRMPGMCCLDHVRANDVAALLAARASNTQKGARRRRNTPRRRVAQLWTAAARRCVAKADQPLFKLLKLRLLQRTFRATGVGQPSFDQPSLLSPCCVAQPRLAELKADSKGFYETKSNVRQLLKPQRPAQRCGEQRRGASAHPIFLFSWALRSHSRRHCTAHRRKPSSHHVDGHIWRR